MRTALSFLIPALPGLALFSGCNPMEDHIVDSHRYYSIPDEIEIGKQCVEVVFDVDGFTIGGYDYPPLKEQVFKYMFHI